MINGKDFDRNRDSLDDGEKDQLRQIESILIHPHDYIHFAGHVDHFRSLPEYYSRSKVCVLASLVEGKNRSIHEAMSCNTPVICFHEFNEHIRRGNPVIPEGAGLYATYAPESLADTIHSAIENPDQFKPRKGFLQAFGRRRLLNTCVEKIPYFAQAIPGYVSGQAYSNLWLDMAIQHSYQVGLHDFLYGRTIGISQVRGLEAIGKAVEFYSSRLGL